jgi:hypothetical protein
MMTGIQDDEPVVAAAAAFVIAWPVLLMLCVSCLAAFALAFATVLVTAATAPMAAVAAAFSPAFGAFFPLFDDGAPACVDILLIEVYYNSTRN